MRQAQKRNIWLWGGAAALLLIGLIGLDGTYRLSPEGQGRRGYREDAQTFVLELFDIGQLTRRLHFDGERLEVTIPEVELTIDCQVQAP